MIGLYRSVEDETKCGVVHSYRALWRETFEPIEWDIIILDKVRGDTYADKKNVVEECAIWYSYMMDIPMSWSEVAEIGAWFEKYGRRYGLLEEFRENGIC